MYECIEKSFVLFLLDRWKSLTGLKKNSLLENCLDVYCLLAFSFTTSHCHNHRHHHHHRLHGFYGGVRDTLSLFSSLLLLFFSLFFMARTKTTMMMENECCVASLLAVHTAATKASSSSTISTRVYTSLVVWCYITRLLAARHYPSTVFGGRETTKENKKFGRLSRREIKWKYIYILYL